MYVFVLCFLQTYIHGLMKVQKKRENLFFPQSVCCLTLFIIHVKKPYLQPQNILAHLYIHGNGTAECNGVYFCGNRGLANTCSNTDFCTNCNQDFFSSIIPEGEGVCAFNETIPPAYIFTESISPTFSMPPVQVPQVPVPSPPTTIPTAGYPVSRQCFVDRNELREAVRIYLQGDVNGTIRSMYGDPIGSWCVGNVTDFSYLFSGCNFKGDSYTNVEARTFNKDISKWDMSSATSLVLMFCQAEKFNQDLSTWNVSSVKDVFGMFQNAYDFQGTGVGLWDVKRVTDMRVMFQWAINFNEELKFWDVSSVTAMSYMFKFSHSFSGNLTLWNVGKVTEMNEMFRDARTFNSDVSSWDVSKVKSMIGMFRDTKKYNQNLCPWGESMKTAGTNATSMFGDVTSCPSNSTTPDLNNIPPGPLCHVCST